MKLVKVLYRFVHLNVKRQQNFLNQLFHRLSVKPKNKHNRTNKSSTSRKTNRPKSFLLSLYLLTQLIKPLKRIKSGAIQNRISSLEIITVSLKIFNGDAMRFRLISSNDSPHEHDISASLKRWAVVLMFGCFTLKLEESFQIFPRFLTVWWRTFLLSSSPLPPELFNKKLVKSFSSFPLLNRALQMSLPLLRPSQILLSLYWCSRGGRLFSWWIR